MGSTLDSKIAGIEPSLVNAYEGIANRAPSATIIVMGYPRFFPSSPPAFCYTGIGPYTFIGSQMSWMNSEIQKLDTQIQAAVTAAQQAGKNVLYEPGRTTHSPATNCAQPTRI